jgi:hypothetical protein
MANLKEDNKFFLPITSHIDIEPRTVRRFFLLFLSQNHEFRAGRAAGELGAVVSRNTGWWDLWGSDLRFVGWSDLTG